MRKDKMKLLVGDRALFLPMYNIPHIGFAMTRLSIVPIEVEHSRGLWFHVQANAPTGDPWGLVISTSFATVEVSRLRLFPISLRRGLARLAQPAGFPSLFLFLLPPSA